MYESLVRATYLAIGIGMLLAGLLPPTIQHVNIDRHSIKIDKNDLKQYRIHYSGSETGFCDVAQATFLQLDDGDDVAISTSSIFNSCTRIEHNHAVIYTNNYQKYLFLLFGILFIAGGSGLIKRNSYAK